MKKIVMGIAAAALATSMFAAEPAFDASVTEFTGNAEVKWGVNLDTEKTGFVNKDEANLKMKLFAGGDKATEGEGVWADIKVKCDDAAWKAENGDQTIVKASIDHAKIWIEKFYVGIQAGDIQTKEFKPTLGLKSDSDKTVAYVGKLGSDAYTQGIIAGYEDGNLNIGVDFRSDKAAQYTDKYGFAARVELKDGNEWVNGLGVKVDLSKAIETSETPTYLSAIASYKIAIDDTYYVKPQVAYATEMEKSDVVAAGLLFGWGAEADANPGLYFFDNDDWKKITPGVSVAYAKDLWKDKDFGKMEVAFYSGDIVENLKAAAYMDFDLIDGKDFDETLKTVAGACQYAIKADDVTVTLKAGVKYNTKYGDKPADAVKAKYGWANNVDDAGNLILDDTEPGLIDGGTTDPVWIELEEGKAAGVAAEAFQVKVGVDVAGLINNTTFSAEYASGNLNAKKGAGTINVGCKIAL